MQTPLWETEERLRVFTDAPVNYIHQSDGFLDFDRPCNVVVQRETTELHLAEAESRLAIRCAFRGERHFEAGGGRFVVDDTGYLILNPGMTVSSSLQSPTPVECFNITFRPGFAEDVLHSLVTPADRLLETPYAPGDQPVEFFVKRYPHDETLSPVLSRMRSTLKTEQVSYGWVEDQCHELVERMLTVHRSTCREIEAIPSVRHATRVEVYLRLTRARDFMEASLSEPITLVDLAAVACCSPHHFLRLFKQHFGETPHQYLMRLRLQRACTLLKHTEMPVTEICFRVGFESLGSFSWLFRRRLGLSPSEYRASDLPLPERP